MEKMNGINPNCLRKVYYRIVYYKTLRGKDGSKILRCRKSGEILAKSKIWQMANVVSNTAENEAEQKKNEKLALEKVDKISGDRKAKKWQDKKKKEIDAKQKMMDIAKMIAKGNQPQNNEKPKKNTEDDDFWNLDSSDDDEPKVKKSLKLDNMKHLPLKEVSKAQTKNTVKQAQVPSQNSSDSPFINNSSDEFKFDWSSDENKPPTPPRNTPPKKEKPVETPRDPSDPSDGEYPTINGTTVDRVDIEKRTRPSNYGKPLTIDEINIFNHNNTDGALGMRQMCAYMKVLRSKFQKSKNKKQKWLIEDPYFFEDMKPPIDKAFLKRLNEVCKKYTRIYLPILTFNSLHWAGIMLDTRKHMVIIYEPTITRTDFTEYFKVMEQALYQCGTGFHWGVDFSKNHSQQFDQYNCGVFTLKNLSDLVLNGKTKVYTSNDKKDKEKNKKIIMEWRQQFKNEIIDYEGVISKKDLNDGEVQSISSSESDEQVDNNEYNINSPEVINLKQPLVYKEELKILDESGPDSWIDDRLLEAGFTLIRPHLKEDAMIEDVYFYNTIQSAMKKDSKYVDEWHKQYMKLCHDVDYHKRIYFPVCYDECHWILICVDTQELEINVYDSEHHKDYKNITDKIRDIFAWPHNDGFAVVYHPEIPLQTDGNNCGMFVLKNIECLEFNSGKFNYTQKDMTKFRKQFKQELIRYCGGNVIDRKTFRKLSGLRKMRDAELKRRGLKEEKQILD